MAESGDAPLDALEAALTCSACGDIFNDPRVLPCSHRFCGACLVGSGDGRCAECKLPFYEKDTRCRDRRLCGIVDKYFGLLGALKGIGELREPATSGGTARRRR